LVLIPPFLQFSPPIMDAFRRPQSCLGFSAKQEVIRAAIQVKGAAR
jgi:hypothetical protein